MEETSYITEEKKQALLDELKHLTTVKRKDILESLEAAKALGDLSENAEYHQAREDQGKTEDQIEYMLQSSVVVKKHHSTKIEIGTTAVVKKEGSKDTISYSIVGAEEADMIHNKISNKSPLGEALFGKKKGDVVSIKTPKGLVKYTLVDIQ